MKIFISLVVLALALASCQSTSKIDTALQQNLPKVCSALRTGHTAFVAIAAVTAIKQSTVDKEQAAYDGVVVLCSDPGNTTLPDAIIRVTQAVVIVTAALKEARRAQNG